MSGDVVFRCAGKEAFNSPRLAAKIAKKMNRRDRVIHSFRCEHCGLWHVGQGNGVRTDYRTGKRLRDNTRRPERMTYEDWKAKRAAETSPED